MRTLACRLVGHRFAGHYAGRHLDLHCLRCHRTWTELRK